MNQFCENTQLEDPRQEWRTIQEAMLREYLVTAQDILEAKKDIYNIKSKRLMLAQDEYDHLNNVLKTTLTTSTTSLCSSTSSVSTKYDPDLLKSDVALARNRVSRLKSELELIKNEMTYTQQGVETLSNVEQKLSVQEGTCYNLAEAHTIVAELRNIQKSLSSGEKEKAELMQSLTKLKDDLIRLQLSEYSLNGSTLSLPQETLSTASQTDLTCELVPIGTRLAEMAKMRLEYDETRKKVQHIQQTLADLEEKVQPDQIESDKDRLLLFQEKEQLLRELKSITPRIKSKEEISGVHIECKKLEKDLNKALELSNKDIAYRLRLHEEKQLLLQQLKYSLQEMTHLESQLKTLSASTLSVSSSSSLGSLSTTSSKGSLSSVLSFTDIYGGPKCLEHSIVEKCVDMEDLQRRVEILLKNDDISHVTSSSRSPPLMLPSSSLSVSPIDSPKYENLPYIIPLTTYEQDDKDTTLESEQKQSNEKLELISPNVSISCRGLFELQTSNMSQELERPSKCFSENLGDPSLSPISETPPLIDRNEILRRPTFSRTLSSDMNTRSVSAAVSDESVAGDSGVFEESNGKIGSEVFAPELVSEIAQVRIKLRYDVIENMLNITIEKARHLNALLTADTSHVFIKTALLPADPIFSSTYCTQPVNDLEKATFGDMFNIYVPATKIFTKTLQINVWSKCNNQQETCVGCTQVSLADMNVHNVSKEWYNILSLQEKEQTSIFLKEELDYTQGIKCDRQMGKEESSDDSTVISSQTSTLTRNQENVFSPIINLNFEKLYKSLKNTECDSDDSEECIEEGYEEKQFTKSKDISDFEDCYYTQDLRYSDKQTNTECVFYPEHSKQIRKQEARRLIAFDERGVIKRSQTFSPSAHVSKYQYICKLNRSDSDSAMPLYRRGSKPFERNTVERKSVRFRRKSGSMVTLSLTNKSLQNTLPTTARTSIDLELDLQAQHTKLDMLNSELLRLRELIQRLETAKEQGDMKMATYMLENQQFQHLIAHAEICNMNKTPEERKVETMLRKISKEIYKLRKFKAGNGKPDLISFREKMAFFTTKNNNVPFLPRDECHLQNITLKRLNDMKLRYTNSEIIDNIESKDNNERNSDKSSNRHGYTVEMMGVEV